MCRSYILSVTPKHARVRNWNEIFENICLVKEMWDSTAATRIIHIL